MKCLCDFQSDVVLQLRVNLSKAIGSVAQSTKPCQSDLAGFLCVSAVDWQMLTGKTPYDCEAKRSQC